MYSYDPSHLTWFHFPPFGQNEQQFFNKTRKISWSTYCISPSMPDAEKENSLQSSPRAWFSSWSSKGFSVRYGDLNHNHGTATHSRYHRSLFRECKLTEVVKKKQIWNKCPASTHSTGQQTPHNSSIVIPCCFQIAGGEEKKCFQAPPARWRFFTYVCKQMWI